MSTPTVAQQVGEQQMRDALARLQFEQAERDAATQAEVAQRDAEAWAEVARAREQAEAQAVRQLSELKSVYAERAELARAAIDALEKLCDLDSTMRERLSGIDAGLREHWLRVDPRQRPARWQELRRHAGLAESHRQLGIALAPKSPSARRAATAILGVLCDAILPGEVRVGGKSMLFNLDG